MADMWEVLGKYPSNNGQVKVVARRGHQVVHIDRLTQVAADTITQAQIQAFWERTKS